MPITAKVGVVMLSIGVLFDLLSLLYGIASIMTKQYKSGFLFVALPFYGLAMLMLPTNPDFLITFTSASLIPTKITLFLLLCLFHFICQSPNLIFNATLKSKNMTK